MRMKSITAGNFKSLVDFRLDLAMFTCLIGLNGAGKSTVLQFIDFLTQQVRGDIGGWLKERDWHSKDLYSKLSSRKNIEFSVKVLTEEGEGEVKWNGTFNTVQRHCSAERLDAPGAILEVKDGNVRIVDLTKPKGQDQRVIDERISFSYEGSVLSQLKQEVLPKPLLEFKAYFGRIRSLDLLSPQSLRQRTRHADNWMGLGGQRLSAFLHEMGKAKQKHLTRVLQKVYKQLKAVDTTSLKSGWKQLEIEEQYGEKVFMTQARHINDGMLRLMAILAEVQSSHHFLLFDEIENGINPELVEFVINALTTTHMQVLVTTHSPMILNYLSDDLAKAGVIYLYKTSHGGTRAIPFFSIPSLAKKLEVMGPGEVFVETNLTLLGEEIEQMPEGR